MASRPRSPGFQAGFRSAVIALVATASARAQDPIWSVSADFDPSRVDLSARSKWVPDHDGDGVSDVLLASLASDHGGDFEDVVQLRSGADGAFLHEWNDATSFQLGAHSSGAGDIDADGIGDFAFVDLFFAVPDENVWIYSGATYAPILAYTPESQSVHRLIPLGDVDADGHDDFVVSLPGIGSGAGAVRWISGRDGTALFKRRGDTDMDGLGARLARIADLDGDSFPEVAAGAPQNWFGTGGYVRIFSGRTGAIVRDLFGPAGVSEFGGFGLDDAGDVDGDGIHDVIVSTPGYDLPSGPNAGLVMVFSGADGSTLFEAAGANPGDYFGTAAVGLGDVNGDGFSDFHTWRSNDAVIWSGRTLQVLYRFDGSDTLEIAGSGANLGSDVDGDGRADLLLIDFHGTAEPNFSVRGGNDLWLLSEPDVARASDVLTFTTGENDPGLLTIRFLVEVDGVPLMLAIPPFGTFGGDRRRVESFVLPPGLGVHTLVHVSFAQGPARGVLVSGRETLRIE